MCQLANKVLRLAFTNVSVRQSSVSDLRGTHSDCTFSCFSTVVVADRKTYCRLKGHLKGVVNNWRTLVKVEAVRAVPSDEKYVKLLA